MMAGKSRRMWDHFRCGCLEADVDYSDYDNGYFMENMKESGRAVKKSMDVCPPGGSTSDQLRLAASQGHLKQVEDCLHAGATFDADQDGRTALHYAALNGYTDVTRFLIERGCPINIQDQSGYTALHRAASQGHVNVITALLEAGCDVNTQDEHGNAAVHEAAWNGFSKTLELLIKFNVNSGIVNKAGFTPLHLAAQNGHNESSRVLLYASCHSDQKNNYGDTALHTAARYGHAGVTRILISARSKLHEANKNGDTALHIAAALKRRKIAKLLVESGIDVSLRNKQNETAVDVAMRKEHDEIISIVQSYSRRNTAPRPLKEVNFKEGLLEGPMVVPDLDVPEKPDPKPEKGKKFFFFKKKKKDKDKGGQHGVVPQKTVPGTRVNLQGSTPVQGFFSKYVPRQGVQYYRDLAGNVKQGPVGYSPTCNCMPALHRLQQQVHDTRENVYGQMHTTQQALQEHLEQVDHRSSLRVNALEQFTRDRFTEEETLCRQRIDERYQDRENQYGHHPQDQVRGQIQNWLEQKLEGYGHCLQHHHDDSALPNENIFSDIHETANGRLFKSRSDETLSQSDNHSGKFRKREFYESRQAAMQTIRAWQVPAYSKDRERVRVTDKQAKNNPPSRSQSKQHVNSQQEDFTRPPYPVEPIIEVRTRNRASDIPMQSSTPVSRAHPLPYHAKVVEDQTYVSMNMSGFQNQGALPKQTNLPQPQAYPGAVGRTSGTYTNGRSPVPVTVGRSPGQVTKGRSSGPVTTGHGLGPVTRGRGSGPMTHSTPKSRDTSPYEVHRNITRSHTDSGLSQNLTDSSRQLQQTLSEQDVSANSPRNHYTVSSVTTPRVSSRQLNFGSSEPESGFGSRTSPQKPLQTSVSQSTGVRNSMSSDKFVPEAPKPTFTTFGYDDLTDGHAAPANSPEQNKLPVASTPRGHNSDSDRFSSGTVYGVFNRQSSQGSLGFVTSPQDNTYMDMTHASGSPSMHQRARSSEGLLDNNSSEYTSMFPRSHSEERTLESHGSPRPAQSRSSSETREVVSTIAASSRSLQQRSPVPQPQMSYTRTPTHPQYSSTPFSSQGNQNRPTPPPKPTYTGNTTSQYGSVGGVQRTGDIRYNVKGYSSPQRYGDMTSDNTYSTVRESKLIRDKNQNFTVTADVYTPSSQAKHIHPPSNVQTGNQLEARSQHSYQTYLTGDQHFTSDSMYNREHSPNICNNSKEDSSSNPDSGYSSKIYGNRAGSVVPASSNSTPSSSFSTDRGISIPSNTDSPQSQYSNGDYEGLPKKEYHDEVQTHVQTWYQRKLQETTQKVYDSWRAERSSPPKIGQNGGTKLPVRTYGNSDYAKINYSSSPAPVVREPMSGQYPREQASGQYGGHLGQHTGMNGSPFLVHSSDV